MRIYFVVAAGTSGATVDVVWVRADLGSGIGVVDGLGHRGTHSPAR